MSTTQHDQNRDPITDTDLHHMTRKGWFPKTDFPDLEALRERHEQLIDQRDAKQAERRALWDQYKAENTAKQDELDAAYREGREPKAVTVTAEADRKTALEETEAHATAAARAVVAFAYEAREKLRGCAELPEGWNPHLSAQAMMLPGDGAAATVLRAIRDEERALLVQMDEAKRAMEAANLRLREYQPLTVWLARNGNAGPGQVMPGNDLPVPVTHTPGTKPRDLPVEGWWPDPNGDGEPIEDSADEGYVDQSDDWFEGRDTEGLTNKEL